MTERFERLVDHMEWANARALEAVRGADPGQSGTTAPGTTEPGTAEPGPAGPLRLLAHVLGAEQVWLERIRTGDSSGLEIWPELTPYQCGELMERNVRGYRKVLADASARDLDSPVRYENSSGTEYRTPLGEILLQVFLHGEHHRGQIARELRRAGADPANTDFITFSRRHPVVPGAAGPTAGDSGE